MWLQLKGGMRIPHAAFVLSGVLMCQNEFHEFEINEKAGLMPV